MGITKNQVLIEYTAKKLSNYEKAFKPLVYVNGKWIYSICHAKKTWRGAIAEAKHLAEQHSQVYPSQYNNVEIRERTDLKCCKNTNTAEE